MYNLNLPAPEGAFVRFALAIGAGEGVRVRSMSKSSYLPDREGASRG